MEFLKKLQKDYSYDILAFSVLSIIFIILAHIFVTHQGNPLIDSFAQGAYIPSEVLKGRILYKDLMIPYGPFSYQLNAELFLIFGEHLNTLYTTGIVNSLIILTTIYLIARSISSRLTAFTITLMVMALCVFHYYVFNYIFPYTYAMTYALSAFLLSLLFTIYYIKHSNPKFIPFSFLFIGLSILTKPDFFLFLFILLAIIVFLKPIPGKYLIQSLIISLIIPVISWSTLFLQGLTIADLSSYILLMKKFISSPNTKYFYGAAISLTQIKLYLGYHISSLKYILTVFFIPMLFIYPALLLIHNKYTKWKLSKLIQNIIILAFYFITPMVIILLNKSFRNIRLDFDFCWIAITTLLIALFILIYHLIKHKNPSNILKNLSAKDKIMILIAIAGSIAALRSNFFIAFQSFGTYLIPLLLIVNVVFIIDYLPGYFKFLNKEVWKKTCAIILTGFAISISVKYRHITNTTYTHPISSAKGIIHAPKIYAEPLNVVKDYIKKEMPDDASFIMIPQSPILNFLTDHPSHGWYYDLIPPSFFSFGEANIIKDLKENPPDYIFVNNRDTAEWGAAFFGKDYGFKLNDFIDQNYKLEKIAGNEFWIKIYKKKD
ncbi:MAG: hypothetical protein ACD_20C00241G0003 [uncultured bacterium]|nr:MAG: hypothetical protein ACD_20C00241G0003 [uncultured bacterium]